MENFEELRKEYPMERKDMSIEKEREFVNHCFDLYEKEGFSKIFWTPYDALSDRIGEHFSTIERVRESQEDLECLPMWYIKFEDGHKTCAYPEEIIPSEMITNGCELRIVKNMCNKNIMDFKNKHNSYEGHEKIVPSDTIDNDCKSEAENAKIKKNNMDFEELKQILSNHKCDGSTKIIIEYSGEDKLIRKGDCFNVKSDKFEVINDDRLNNFLFLKI